MKKVLIIFKWVLAIALLVVVLSFTELPENKKVKVVATIGEQISTKEKEKSDEHTNV